MKENQKIESDLAARNVVAAIGLACFALAVAWLFWATAPPPSNVANEPAETKQDDGPMVFSAAFQQTMPTSLLALTGQAVGVNAFVRVPAGAVALVTDYGVRDGKVYLVLTVQDGSGTVNLYAWKDEMRGWRRE